MSEQVDSLDLTLVAQAQEALKTIDQLIGRTSDLHYTLANMMDSLSGTSFKRQTEAIRTSSKQMADTLIQNFKITNRDAQKEIRGITTTLAKMQRDFNLGKNVDVSEFREKFLQLNKIVYDNATAIENNMQRIVDAGNELRKAKLYVPEGVVSDLGDDWNAYRTKSFGSFTRNPNDQSFDAWLEEHKEFRDVITDADDLTEAFKQMCNAIETANNYAHEGAKAFSNYKSELRNGVLSTVNEQYDGMLSTLKGAMNPQSVTEQFQGINVDNLIDPNSIANLSTYMSSLAESIQKMNGVQLADIGLSQFANDVSQLNKVDFPSVASGVAEMSTAFANLTTGGQNISDLATGLRELAPALLTISQIQMGEVGQVQRRIAKLASLDFAGLDKSADAIRKMGESLRSLENITTAGEKLESFAKAINRLGYQSTVSAVENLPKLAQSLREVMQTLHDAPSVASNIIDMTNALAGLAQSMHGVSQQAPKANEGILGFFKSTNKTGSSFKGLASSIGMFYAKFWMLLKLFNKAKDAINLSSDLTEVQNVVNHTFGAMTQKVNEFAQNDALKNFGMSELSAKTFASRFQAMTNAMGISNKQMEKASSHLDKLGLAYGKASDGVEDMSLNITKLTADYASFFNEDLETVAERMNSIWTGQTKPLRAYGIDLTNATLQQWALNNGINANIKTMTQAEKTMLRYQYVMANSKEIMGDFARTSDRMCVA